MGLNGSNREKEIKLESKLKYSQIVSILTNLLPNVDFIKGKSTDLYWKSHTSKADFMRFRTLSNDHGELTVKHTDKKCKKDRLEIDVIVNEPKKVKEVLTRALGSHIGSIHKVYTVFFMDQKGSNISVYYIPKEKRTFIEIEATNQKTVRKLYNIIKNDIKHDIINMDLYTLFLKRNKK